MDPVNSPDSSAGITGSPAQTGSDLSGNAPPSAGGASGAPSASASPESGNIRQLREQYETTKGQLSEWDKIGKREDVSQGYQIYMAQRNQALELAKELGFDEAQVLNALHQDLVGTLAFLQSHQAENGKNPDVGKQLKDMLDKELQPFRSEREQQQIAQASQRYDSEFDRLYKEAFPQGLPADVVGMLYDMATTLFGADADALTRIRTENKVSDVAKYFSQAKERLLKVLTAWGSHETKQVGGSSGSQKPSGQNGAAPSGGGKKGSLLDDMINGNFDFKV